MGLNPQIVIKDLPDVVFKEDSLRVASALFFSLTNVHGSTGGGIEEDIAMKYAKIAVVFVKSGVYSSRMSTGSSRSIVLEYDDAEAQREQIANVFRRLREYAPGVGVGTCDAHGNALLGFEGSAKPICLPGLIYSDFPELTLKFEKYFTG